MLSSVNTVRIDMFPTATNEHKSDAEILADYTFLKQYGLFLFYCTQSKLDTFG